MADFRRPPTAAADPASTRPTAQRGRREKAKLESEQAVYDHAVASLARSAKTVAQLRRQLRQRTPPGELGEALIDAVITRLQAHGYLSDSRYAESYAGARMAQARLGRRRVAQELLQKGVPPDLVARQVAVAFAQTDDAAQARAFLAKKRVRPPTDERDAARIFRMLARAGFSAGTAAQALRQLRADGAPGQDTGSGQDADRELGDMADSD